MKKYLELVKEVSQNHQEYLETRENLQKQVYELSNRLQLLLEEEFKRKFGNYSYSFVMLLKHSYLLDEWKPKVCLDRVNSYMIKQNKWKVTDDSIQQGVEEPDIEINELKDFCISMSEKYKVNLYIDNRR